MTSYVPVAPLAAHPLLVFLLQVGTLLLLGLLFGRLARRCGMPAVVGELTVGLLLGHSVLGRAAPPVADWLFPQRADQFQLLDAVSQLGVLLLVGLTAIDLDFGLVRRHGATAVRISVAGLVIPLGLGVAVGFALPAALVPGDVDRTVLALFVGVAMAVSAIPVIAKTLADLNLMHRTVGQLTLVAGVVDDVFGWLLLSVVAAMASSGLHAGDVGQTVFSLVATVALAAAAGRPLARAAVTRLGRLDSPGPTTNFVVVVVVLVAAATQAIGLEAVFGAFVGGALLNLGGIDPARIAPLRAFVMAVLAPLFFATVGLRMDLVSLGRPAVALAAVAVLGVAVASKFLGAMVGAWASGLTRWEGVAVGAGMNARGVVQVVIASEGLRLGVLSTELYTIVVLVAVATSIMAAPVLRLAMRRVEYTADEELRRQERERVTAVV